MSDSELPEYWQSLTARAGELDPAVAGDEFAEPLPLRGGDASTATRRDFLKLMGLSSAAMVAACNRAPVQKIIPALVKPEDIIPGVAAWYASTCAACSAACGILIKTRDGRPIKLEGNDAHPVSGGGVCAVGQASVLSLYDASRARGPLTDRGPTAWDALDAAVRKGLEHAAESGRAIRVVVPPVQGPTARAALSRFLSRYGTARAVLFSPLGEAEAVADGYAATHGVRGVPDLGFEEAAVVAGFGADFLGTWISPVAFTRGYARRRDPARGMSRHFQLEPVMTLTGSNADVRLALPPSEMAPALAALCLRLMERSDAPAATELREALGRAAGAKAPDIISDLASALERARGAGLVVCGSADLAAQALAATANELLGNVGKTVRLDRSIPLGDGFVAFGEFLEEVRAGTVGAVLLLGVNPVYGHPDGEEIGRLLAKVDLSVSTADRLDETAQSARHLAPAPHFLEGWGDAAPRRDLVSLSQPALMPLYDTRDPSESLLRWAGETVAFYDFLRARWEREVFPAAAASAAGFEAFWDRSVHDGFAPVVPAEAPAPAFRPKAVIDLLAAREPSATAGGLELALYQKVALRDGALANNAWLQEMPDPISKVTWGNYAALEPSLAARLGLSDGALVSVVSGEREVVVPVLVQPGTHPDVVAVAVGYGRTRVGPVGNGIGGNAFPLAPTRAGRVALTASGIHLKPTGKQRPLAQAQTHGRLEGRPLVREVALAALGAPGHDGDHEAPHGTAHEAASMWSGHAYEGHRWAMAVDLNACTGCSACVVSCQAENNIPTVGEVEVRRRREMHWLRLDRYYAGSLSSPRVVHQPMLCLHCENAPCETVCPVLATVHSSEGLNQQVYNRCVGTRYCANNCPPKARRFNWFDYRHDDPVANLVLNPDVVVRSRGVMEKCSFCVQRIQEVKALARREGRALRDGDVRTACQQSCPAGAIAFGDLNDPESRVSHLARDARVFPLLAEVNLEPRVRYLAKVRNGEGGVDE